MTAEWLLLLLEPSQGQSLGQEGILSEKDKPLLALKASGLLRLHQVPVEAVGEKENE